MEYKMRSNCQSKHSGYNQAAYAVPFDLTLLILSSKNNRFCKCNIQYNCYISRILLPPSDLHIK